MGSKRGPVGLLVVTAAFLVLALGASGAQAEFGIARWEALTCKTDASAFGLGRWDEIGDPCVRTDETSRFYTQAAGHPNFGINAFLMNQTETAPFLPDGFLKRTRVELPEGLAVNPQATPQCTPEQVEEVVVAGPPTITKCKIEQPGAEIGVDFISTLASPAGPVVTIPAFVFNVETPDDPSSPFFGAPSMAGFNPAGKEATFLVGDLNPKDQHISFTTEPDLESPLVGGAPVIGSRLVFNGKAGAGYITLPSECNGQPQRSPLIATSQTDEEDSSVSVTPYSVTSCDKVPFEPGIDVTSGGKQTDSPNPSTVNVTIPFNPDPEGITNSQLHVAKVTLPEGAGINPSAGNGIASCTDAQFGLGTGNPITCPAASRIGSIEVETPSLPGILGGEVYVGQQLNGNSTTGETFRIFLHVTSARFGVNVRLLGRIFPNPVTGRLTVVVAENPQAPFESFRVHIDGGAHGVLTSPDTCGPHTTNTALTPFSSATDATPSSAFSLSEIAGGGPCPKTLAERPFKPSYQASPVSIEAGKFTPLNIDLGRAPGSQEVKRIDVNLPPGMVAKLKGTEYCPQSAIEAATKGSGKGEIASRSCPSNSLVGSTRIAAGSGPDPFQTDGKVYLAGPYKGAPLSMVFVTPAVAGPYDLGNVVVRAALNVDPETAEIHAVSDPIPNVFNGVKLDIRSIAVRIDRKNFTVNPTTCREPLSINSTIFGGGGNPANEAQWQQVTSSNGIQFVKCKSLQFKPRFFARIFGGKHQTQRAQNPKFRAILAARNGDANLRRASFILPRATILDQSHIKTICTRVQLAANECPKNAIYGHARATSPLLAKPLKGPVYLTSSSHELPDLLADLHGQVPIRLRGVISSQHGRLKTVFNNTPDVAVRKFELTMKGGNRGLLVNSRNLCARQTNGFLNLLAQNSRRMRTKNLRLNIPACHGGKRHHKK
ncbi:MAG TPA: hypothetical protein VFI17_05430 [Solirubrobacterales bacterium]|nr:hypothetical protein [Solirubrobacterales bacterium]